jgi:hypothetical protein
MTKTAPAPTHEFLDELRRSPAGAQIVSLVAGRRLAERQKLAVALAEAEQSYIEEEPELAQGVERAIDELRQAELALVEQRSMLDIANGARSSAFWELERLRNLYAGQLRAGSSPLIAEFRSWAGDELDLLARKFESARSVEKNILGERVEQRKSNAKSLTARRQALLAALRRVEELQLEPDDATVEKEIAALKAALPEIEGLKL